MNAPRYPLAASPRHWTLDQREALEEKSAVIEADHGCSRALADARAEAVIRAQWNRTPTLTAQER